MSSLFGVVVRFLNVNPGLCGMPVTKGIGLPCGTIALIVEKIYRVQRTLSASSDKPSATPSLYADNIPVDNLEFTAQMYR